MQHPMHIQPLTPLAVLLLLWGPGARNISNCLSIRTNFTRSAIGLQQYAHEAGCWSGQGMFDWAAAFSDGFVPPAGKRAPGG
jgi:hypothetical protein